MLINSVVIVSAKGLSYTYAVADFIFFGSKITVDGDCSHRIKRYLLLGRKADKPRQRIKKQKHHFANKGRNNQSYGFSSSHVQMWELDQKKKVWALKNRCFQIVVLEKTLESPMKSREIKAVNPIKEINPEYSLKGCWSWNSNILAYLAKNWLIGKDPDSGKVWG